MQTRVEGNVKGKRENRKPIVFHGISINREVVVFDGSEAPFRIVAKSLLSSEKLVPVATLNKIRIPCRPVESNLITLAANRDKLPSGKQILALTLIYKFKLEEGAEVKPLVPLLNNRIYDTKFEAQFYMISDSNKRVYATGDVYPKYTKVPKGDYTLQLYIRHDNVHFLDKMKELILFIERKLEKKDFIQLNFFSQPDGPIIGNGSFKSSVLVPGELEAFFVGPPTKDKLPKSCLSGSVLHGRISYGKVSLDGKKNEQSQQQPPRSYQIFYIVPPVKVDECKGKDTSTRTKSIPERLEEEVRDAKLKFLSGLKQETEEEKLAWKDLSSSLKLEYPKYTPLLAKILDGLVSRSACDDKIRHNQEIVNTATEVIDSIDKEELAKYFSVKYDPEDDEAEKIKKKMELTRDQLVEALYQKGLALAEIESLKVPKLTGVSATVDKDSAKETEKCAPELGDKDLFEENFKEIKKWVDVKSSKCGLLSVIRERRSGRLGTALKLLNGVIEDEGEPAKRKLYDLKIQLIDEIGWTHVASYERQWMHVRFPSCLPLF